MTVEIHDGFARTEVRQVFHNPNATALDAVYALLVPPNATLSEMSIDHRRNRDRASPAAVTP